VTRTQYISCLVSIVAVSVFAADSVLAQKTSELSVDLPNSRTMVIQQKVEQLYDAGVFERAYFIYRNELAPIGDKYAQYMVGFMSLAGLGIEQDPVAALAWYRLAAERGSPQFVGARDDLLRSMAKSDVESAEALYFDLRLKYCDLAVLLASITRDFEDFNTRTGSRLGSDNSPVLVLDPRYGADSEERYYDIVRDQLKARLILLREIGEFQGMNVDPDRLSLRDLRRRVEQRIAADAN
jgi:hypothetical protein